MSKQQRIQKDKLASSSGLFKDNTKLIVKSLIFGFIIGTVFFAVSIFGLVIAFVEFLRPILIPGIGLLLRPFLRNVTRIGPSLWIIGLVLNGLVYTILILIILLIRKYVVDSKVKFFAILLVIIVFLALTGMLMNFYYFLTSPNKSWIFQVGA